MDCRKENNEWPGHWRKKFWKEIWGWWYFSYICIEFKKLWSLHFSFRKMSRPKQNQACKTKNFPYVWARWAFLKLSPFYILIYSDRKAVLLNTCIILTIPVNDHSWWPSLYVHNKEVCIWLPRTLGRNKGVKERREREKERERRGERKETEERGREEGRKDKESQFPFRN